MTPAPSLWRKAYLVTLALSVPAMLAVCFAVGKMELLRFAVGYLHWNAVVGLIAMAAFGELSGPALFGPLKRYPLLGGPFGMVVLAVGTVAGSLVTGFLVPHFSVVTNVLRPLVALELFGGGPAFVIGFGFALYLRRASSSDAL